MKLSPERWQSVSPYFDRALELTTEDRVGWLASLRATDPTLAADVETLLEQRDALSREGYLDGVAPARPPEASLAGQAVGAYTLVSQIGQGGMGSVWLARRSDGRFEGQVAVKLLNASLVGRSGGERFEREGHILARLRHPHIAHLVDAGISPLGQPYLVLEHVEGRHIDAHCDAASRGVETRIRLFLDVLDAVAHAHANLIVHRDIKPSNVLVTLDGRVKLLDFGIAKLLESAVGAEAPSLTREGGVVLTPEYAAPEQVTGEPITTATDVYSLGVLLYLLLAGRHPAGDARKRPAELLRAILDTEPQRVSDAAAPTRTPDAETVANAARRATTPDRLRRLLRGDLDTIVGKTLKKDPRERYTSVTALAGDLRRYLNHEPIGARPDTLGYRTIKFVRRHRRGVVASAAAVSLIAGLVAFYTVRLAAERDRARHEAAKAARVSELLTELFSGADPFLDNRKGAEPTVRGILDAGAERIQKELAGQPELQAEMLTVIGRVYERLGHPDKSQPLLEQALAIGRSLGPEDERTAQTLNDLGQLLGKRGNYPDAAAMLEQSLALRRRLLGNDHEDVAVTMVELARVYSDQGSLDRAEPLFKEALALRRRVLGEEHRSTATSLNDLGVLMWEKGDLAAAEPLLRQNLAILRKIFGEGHPNLSATLNNLSLILAAKGGHAEAEALLRQSLAINEKALGKEHPDRVFPLNNLAHALREQGKYAEAASVLEDAIRVTGTAHGEEHPTMVMLRVNLARVHLAQGEAALAEPVLRRALEQRLAIFSADDWRIASTRSLLGESLTRLGRFDEAEGMLLDAQRVLKDVPGPQGQEAEATRTRLAGLYEAWKRRAP